MSLFVTFVLAVGASVSFVSASSVLPGGGSLESVCSTKCMPTCKVPNPINCKLYSKCDYCGKGNVYDSDTKKCVKIEECPPNQGCNSDENAGIRANPPPCPSTCTAPNESPCKKKGLDVGCVCNGGYILSKNGGKCIEPNSCPSGNPCGVNGTFSCQADCISDYCPVDDSRNFVICDYMFPCPTGCICNYKYQWKSREDKKCILAQECPEMACTSRPNEEWDVCPSPCFTDDCFSYNDPPSVCNTFVEPECYPQCVCKKGYARDGNGICVKGESCPGYCEKTNATYTKCTSACPKTCKQPRGPDACKESCNGEGCQCNPGLVLYEGNCIDPKECPPSMCKNSCRPTCKVPNPKNCNAYSRCNYCGKGKVFDEETGECVMIHQCRSNEGCNGDKNASIRERPPSCPSTCALPNEMPCEKIGQNVGCVCNPGYILSKNGGKCIEPNSCPRGNPCGVNETYAYCRIDCQSEFCPVDDSQFQMSCDPAHPCPTGCNCKRKYQFRSREDKTCILPQECPPANCTRQNEIWNPCPEPCFSDSCNNFFDPPSTCNTFAEPECYPQCVCQKGYARDNNGDCIVGESCPSSKK